MAPMKTVLAFDAIRPAKKTRTSVLVKLMELYIKTNASAFGIGDRLRNDEEDKALKLLTEFIKYPLRDMDKRMLVMHIRNIQKGFDELVFVKKRVRKINPKAAEVLEVIQGGIYETNQ